MRSRRSFLGLLGAAPLSLALATPVRAETRQEQAARLMSQIRFDLAELNTLGMGSWTLVPADAPDSCRG